MSRKLRREREASMYGDEETGTPPDQLYSRADAEEALSYAETTLSLCVRLLEGFI